MTVFNASYDTQTVTLTHWGRDKMWRHFADGVFKCIFFNENVWISIKIPLNFILKCWINNIPAMVLIMAWRQPGNKPLSEPMIIKTLTHICVTRLNELMNFPSQPQNIHQTPARCFPVSHKTWLARPSSPRIHQVYAGGETTRLLI